MCDIMQYNFHLSFSNAVSVIPAIQVATARRKVVVPRLEWMGTMDDLKEAVAEEQQMRRRKEKTPDTNCRRNIAIVVRPSQEWMLYM